MGLSMKFYGSFLVRCWMIRDPDSDDSGEKFVFDIEHIQKGEHLRSAHAEQTIEWMMSALRAEQSGNQSELRESADATDSADECP